MAAIPSFFSVGPQPLDQLGCASGFALIIAISAVGPGRLSPTNFTSVQPQVYDTGRAAGFAQIASSVVAGPGAVPSAKSIHGTHAVVTYNAEALKTKIWPSVRSPSTSGILGTWFSAAPQNVDLSQQSFVDGPQPNGALPRMMTMVISAPQSVDLTQQPFINAPLVGAPPGGLVPASLGFFGSHAVATYNAEALKTQIWKSAVSRTSGSLGSWVGSAPQQIDLTQQPRFSNPITVGAISPVSPFFRAAPQQVDLTQQPFFDAPVAIGATLRAAPFFTAAPQQVDLTQQGFFDSPISSGPGSVPVSLGYYGTHAVATYNAEAVKTAIWPSVVASAVAVSGRLGSWVSSYPQYVDPLQAWFDAPVTVQGWVLTYISATPDQTEYPTIRGFATPAARPGPTVPMLGAFVNTAPQFEERPTVVARVAQQAGATPRIIPSVIVAEQSYVNSQPSITHAAIASGGPLLGTVVGVGQQFYIDVQPRLYPAVVAGSTPRTSVFFSVAPVDPSQLASFYDAPQVALSTTGPVLPWVWSTPQQFDFTQQPFIDAPQPGLLKGPVPPLLVAAPQYVDLTLQASFSKPMITGQGILGSFVRVLPQQWDYTLPSFVFEPLVVRVSYVVRAPQVLTLGDYGKRIVIGSYRARITLGGDDS